MIMRPKVFLDTNILVSYSEGREGWDKIRVIIQMGINGCVENCASILSLVNIGYLLRKQVGKAHVEEMLKEYESMLTILPMDKKQFDDAFKIKGNDFEDKFQIACAKAYSCKYIITENIKDFKGTPIPTYTPSQFLEHLGMQKIG